MAAVFRIGAEGYEQLEAVLEENKKLTKENEELKKRLSALEHKDVEASSE